MALDNILFYFILFYFILLFLILSYLILFDFIIIIIFFCWISSCYKYKKKNLKVPSKSDEIIKFC